MGNACTCLDEDSKDMDEFRPIDKLERDQKELAAIKIQKIYRGNTQRKKFREMKEEIVVEPMNGEYAMITPLVKQIRDKLGSFDYTGNQIVTYNERDLETKPALKLNNGIVYTGQWSKSK
mmetsp:Transcript_19811/g.18857  ORF Transcript_19811/g.18857 Transcript_19811/m.18857 type:complete len:120 (+) Transcript_19811:2-361(+)